MTGMLFRGLTAARPFVFAFLAGRIACLERLWELIGGLIEYRADLSGLDRSRRDRWMEA
jgi:hypothetical protein